MSEQILFGLRPIIEAIDAGKRIDKIYIKKGADSPIMSNLRERCRLHKITIQEVPLEKLNRMTKGNHQGVVAQISAIEYAEVSELLENIKHQQVPALIVVLDGVTDVRNFGGIARSAECAGANALIISAKNSAPVNADAIRSSAGALNLIPVCRVGSMRNTLKLLKDEGMQLVAATEKSDKILYNTDLKKPTVLILGAEDKGISKEILKMCDVHLSIPILGKIESLNVSVAAGIMLYEVVRQRISVE